MLEGTPSLKKQLLLSWAVRERALAGANGPALGSLSAVSGCWLEFGHIRLLPRGGVHTVALFIWVPQEAHTHDPAPGVWGKLLSLTAEISGLHTGFDLNPCQYLLPDWGSQLSKGPGVSLPHPVTSYSPSGLLCPVDSRVGSCVQPRAPGWGDTCTHCGNSSRPPHL